MGMIQYALEGNYGRFYNDLKNLSKVTGKPAWLMFLDTALCTLTLGSGLQDYLNYEFYNKSFKERATYVTIGFMDRITPEIANIKYSPFISNKANFHKNYGKYSRRDFFDPEGSFEDFEKFLARNEVFVLKPQIGACGHGVQKVVTAEIEDRKAFFEKAREQQAHMEQLIIQHPDWAAMAPGSVNTLRVITGAADGQSWLIYAGARFGSGKSFADNFHQGGCGVLVDMETGKLSGKAINKLRQELDCSATGIPFDGCPVPYWEEIKAMVLEAALVCDDIHLVGWDVAICEDGPMIVEGNRGSGFDLIQMTMHKGTKYMLEDLLKKVRAAKNK